MKFYEIDTELTFGKHSGKTLREIVEIEYSYIHWCLNNIDHFIIDGYTANQLNKVNSSFSLWDEEKIILKERIEEYMYEQNLKMELEMSDVSTYQAHSNEDDFYEEDSDDYSDDDYLNDAFDGDEDAYWNID